MECASKICQIAKQEGMTWMKNSVQSNLLKSRLVDFAKLCKCDLRKILNEMQLFAYTMNVTPEYNSGTQTETQGELDELEMSKHALCESIRSTIRQ